jgi:DNA repair photolyase
MGKASYTSITAKSALNRVRGMPFEWSLNPYRGCVHACQYCYARETHRYFGLNAGRDFESTIFYK